MPIQVAEYREIVAEVICNVCGEASRSVRGESTLKGITRLREEFHWKIPTPKVTVCPRCWSIYQDILRLSKVIQPASWNGEFPVEQDGPNQVSS